MDWIKANWFKIGLLLCLLVIAGVMYKAFVVLPREREREARLAAERKEVDRQEKVKLNTDNRNNCLVNAERKYATYIASVGRKDKKGQVWADGALIDTADQYLKDWQELCFKQYPVD